MTFSVALGFIVLILLGLFHLIPDAYEFYKEGFDTFKSILFTCFFIIIGFAVVIVLDVLGGHHHHEEKSAYKHISFITCVFLVIHNFIEGMTLYSTVLTSYDTAVILTLGIALHNLPLGFTLSSTFNELYGKSKTLLCMVGIGISYLFGALVLYKFTYSFSAVVTTLAGSANGEPGYQDGVGSEALFFFDAAKAEPAEDWKKGSVCVDDDGNVYVGDCVNYCVRKITPDGTVTTLAGLAGNKGCIDGTGVQARFNGLYGMDCDAEGNIILTDVFEWKIRKITPEGVTTTLGETDFEPWFLTVDKRNGDIFVSSSSGIYKWTAEGSTQITTGNFRGIVVDKEGNLYAADQILNGIVKFKAGTWEAENLIGKGTSGYLNGSFEDALFTFPSDLAIDSNGDIYVAGNGAWDGGENLDQSIRLLDMTNRVVRLVAGGTQAGYVDANAGSAAFSGPQDLAVDKNGVIYVYDKKNNVIRKIVYE